MLAAIFLSTLVQGLLLPALVALQLLVLQAWLPILRWVAG